jgi:hypothetical protein
VSWSPTIFSRYGPVELPPVPWIEKQLESHNFSWEVKVNAAVGTWLDGQYSEFFWVTCKI